MKQIFDADSANEVYRENKKENYEYTMNMRTISQALHRLHPSCNIEIRTKLALEGLSEEELNMVW